MKILTRKSPLAMAQTHEAIDFLSNAFKDDSFEIVPLETVGDIKQNWSLENQGQIGLFTKDLEEALLNKTADIAVHSAKDLPAKIADGLCIVGYLPRQDQEDVLIIKEGIQVPNSIATSSPRRRVQLKKMYPQALWSQIRGNVETRLKKLLSSQIDATVLASAGLKRLNISSFKGLKFIPLSKKQIVPAVGQGAIAIEIRQEDLSKFESIFDYETYKALTIERAFLTMLGGGCQAAYAANWENNLLRIFHENCGYKEFDFPFDKDTVESQICEIVKSINL